MARMTHKLVRQIWDSTQKCFHSAVVNYYRQHPDRTPVSLPKNSSDMSFFDSREIQPEDREFIDQMYRDNLLNLTTDELELVVEASKKKNAKTGRAWISRAPVTIDAIVGELLARQLRFKK